MRTLPEEPLKNGGVARMSVVENLALRTFDRTPMSNRWGWLKPAVLRAQGAALIDEYRVHAPSPEAPLDALSGGNVQRVVLARELSGPVRVLVVANPCFGLDFLTAAQIREELRAQRNRGVAVLLISEDLDEILMLSDRVAVISGGRIVMEAETAKTDRMTIGAAMAAHGHHVAAAHLSRQATKPASDMNIDFATLTEYQRYKLMASLIVPRPIALVTTLGPDGVVNAAPFSMFNMLGEEPPIVMISINRLQDGVLKDTAANIARTGEFVVHLADEDIAEQMHRCGERHPPHVSELDVVGFTALPSHAVKPPRIAEAPVAFECTLWETLETASRQIFIGQVRWMHARDELDRHRRLARATAELLSGRPLRRELLCEDARTLFARRTGRDPQYGDRRDVAPSPY